MHGKLKRQAFSYAFSAALLLTIGLYSMGANDPSADAAPYPLTKSLTGDPQLEIGALAKKPSSLPDTAPVSDPPSAVGSAIPATAVPEPVAIPYLTTACYLNIRSDPNNKSKILRVVERGTTISVTETTGNGWLQLSGGGYIHGDYAIPAEPVKEDNQLLQPAVIAIAAAAEPGEPTSKVNSESGLTAAHIGEMLDGTALADHELENAILEIERQFGINAYFTVAVMKLESGNGKSRLAKCKNNLFGLNASGGNAYQRASRFDTKADSVRKFGTIIAKNYVDKGYTTVEKVARKYCPANSDWPVLVKNIMERDFNLL